METMKKVATGLIKSYIMQSITFLLVQSALIAAAVNADDSVLNFTANDVQQDIFASICSFRSSCNGKQFYSAFKERDGSPIDARGIRV